MVIFGGFYKIAKELNDLHIFDFETQLWTMIYEEDVSVVGSPSKIQTNRDMEAVKELSQSTNRPSARVEDAQL